MPTDRPDEGLRAQIERILSPAINPKAPYAVQMNDALVALLAQASAEPSAPWAVPPSEPPFDCPNCGYTFRGESDEECGAMLSKRPEVFCVLPRGHREPHNPYAAVPLPGSPLGGRQVSDSQKWYQENILDVRKTAKSKCCDAPIEDAGECADGCCDHWRCSACKRTWLVEVGD